MQTRLITFESLASVVQQYILKYLPKSSEISHASLTMDEQLETIFATNPEVAFNIITHLPWNYESRLYHEHTHRVMEYYRNTDTFKNIAKRIEENAVDLHPFEILSHALATDNVDSIDPGKLKTALSLLEKNTKDSDEMTDPWLKELRAISYDIKVDTVKIHHADEEPRVLEGLPMEIIENIFFQLLLLSRDDFFSARILSSVLKQSVDNVISSINSSKSVFEVISQLHPLDVMHVIELYRQSEAFDKLVETYSQNPRGLSPYGHLCYALTTDDIHSIHYDDLTQAIATVANEIKATITDPVLANKYITCLRGLYVTALFLKPVRDGIEYAVEEILKTNTFVNLAGLSLKENHEYKKFLLLSLKPYLAGANLEGAQLQLANLDGANLNGANLSKANLTNVTLINAILSNANLENKQLLDVRSLRGANLQGIDLTGISIAYFLHRHKEVDIRFTCLISEEACKTQSSLEIALEEMQLDIEDGLAPKVGSLVDTQLPAVRFALATNIATHLRKLVDEGKLTLEECLPLIDAALKQDIFIEGNNQEKTCTDPLLSSAPVDLTIGRNILIELKREMAASIAAKAESEQPLGVTQIYAAFFPSAATEDVPDESNPAAQLTLTTEQRLNPK